VGHCINDIWYYCWIDKCIVRKGRNSGQKAKTSGSASATNRLVLCSFAAFMFPLPEAITLVCIQCSAVKLTVICQNHNSTIHWIGTNQSYCMVFTSNHRLHSIHNKYGINWNHMRRQVKSIRLPIDLFTDMRPAKCPDERRWQRA